MSDTPSTSQTIQKMHKTKVHVSGLKLGMHICDLDRPWIESPFLVHGFTVKTEQELEAVREFCEHVYIGEMKSGTWVSSGQKNDDDTVIRKPVSPGYSQKQIEEVSAFHREARGAAKKMFEDVRAGESLDVSAVKGIVSECVGSIIHNPKALMWLSQIKNKDEYTAEHSLNVAVLSIALGRQVGLEQGDLETVGLCGMLHDIGKTRIPLEVLNKEGPLTDEEFAIMRTHPEEGRDILVNNGGADQVVIDACYGHHENLRGKGYPLGINESEIGPFTRMVTIADVYDAITSDRCYKPGRASLDALKILQKGRGTQFDASLVPHFISCTGLYPVGSLVELKNGCAGIIVENNQINKNLPKIHMLFDENKEKIAGYCLDLSKLSRREDLDSYSITKPLKKEQYGISLMELMEQGVLSE